MKILVVDDDQFYTQRIVEQLEDSGVESCVVRTAEDALDADLAGFDGVILDLMLPNDSQRSGITIEESRGGFLTGLSVARRLLQKKSGIRIVLLTSVANGEATAWAVEKSIPLLLKGDGYHALLRELRQLGLISGDRAPLAFIVHGHDYESVLELKNYLQNTLKWREPIVLRELPSGGKTIIEKFEDYAHRIDFVFVLLTPDDVARSSSSNEEKRRSRQNVIFEAGFFYGKLDRTSGRVLLLHKGPTELPSDIAGVIWIDISNGIAAAGEEIRREVMALSAQAAG